MYARLRSNVSIVFLSVYLAVCVIELQFRRIFIFLCLFQTKDEQKTHEITNSYPMHNNKSLCRHAQAQWREEDEILMRAENVRLKLNL